MPDPGRSRATQALKRSPLAWLLMALIGTYRRLISPMLAPSCRFYPSCSQYALDAVKAHGALKGAWLATRRLLKCHPFHEGGFDPVPERGEV